MTMLAIGSSRLEAFAQLITLVLIFAFVLALTYFATKWVGNYQKEKMSGSNITVLETMKISGTKYLQIIKIGTKCFAIAVCKDTITYLCEVNEEDLIYRENNSSKLKSENFNAILEKFKKDSLPMKLMQYGAIQFPKGITDELWCYPVAVKKYDGVALRLM